MSSTLIEASISSIADLGYGGLGSADNADCEMIVLGQMGRYLLSDGLALLANKQNKVYW
jgi:hypothetical protein